MFVRVKSTPNSPRRSVQLVESVRVGEKVQQKIVRHIGIAMDDDELRRLKELAELVKAKMQAEHQASLFSPEEVAEQVIESKTSSKKPIQSARSGSNDATLQVLENLREQQRAVLGIHEVYGQVYRQLGFDSLLPHARLRSSNQALFQMVMCRLANPDSKRRSIRMLEQDFGIELALEKVYRMMDQLDDQVINKMQKLVCEHTQTLLGQPVSILFFDCTTLYFESFEPDELKQNGFSKDCKFNQPQVLLALMVTQEGLPVGYEVFPGSTFEGHTLIPMIEQVKKRFNLKRVVCVADRGMLSQANLDALEQAGAYYVVSSRLKNLPKATLEKVLDKSQYIDATDQSEIKFLDHPVQKDKRLIVSWCPKRAAKDEHDRQKMLDKLTSKLEKSQNPKNLLNNSGYKKYVSVQGHASLTLNQAAIESDQRWDGLYGVITNLPDTNAQEVLAHYKGLWQVEESFRITKHDLKVRPIYHWTPRRVRAHIAISFMAFACIRTLTYRVKIQQSAMSAEVIRNALLHVQASIVEDQQTNKRYCIPSQASPEAKTLYQILGLNLPTVPFALN